MLYAIPIVGWFFGVLFHASMALPFWLCWNALAPKFFYWLPPVYQQIGFFEAAGLFIIASILKVVLLPHLAASSSSLSSGKK